MSASQKNFDLSSSQKNNDLFASQKNMETVKNENLNATNPALELDTPVIKRITSSGNFLTVKSHADS